MYVMHNMIRIRIQYFTTRDGNRDIQGTVMGIRGLRLVTRHDLSCFFVEEPFGWRSITT